MTYREQMETWLKKHQKATLEEAWEAGYWQCCDNWCRGEK